MAINSLTHQTLVFSILRYTAGSGTQFVPQDNDKNLLEENQILYINLQNAISTQVCDATDQEKLWLEDRKTEKKSGETQALIM